MTVAYPHIADQLFGRALAIEPMALRAIVEGPLGRRVLSGESFGKKAGKSERMSRQSRNYAAIPTDPVRSQDGRVDYDVTRDGSVAIIPVAGILAKRFDWLAALCGFTTYEGLSATLDAALGDYRVKALMFDVDSPGGQVDGMLELADQILAAREKMPVWAVANSRAASAAYALAGSAQKLFMPRLGMVGSIGAVTMHIDQSAADQANGLKYTAIYSGARKIDGWEHASLSADARAAMQGRIDHCRDALCGLIGRQGRMSAEAAMETEAAIYSDDSAAQVGLIDGVKTFNDALAALVEQVSKSPQSQMSATAAQPGASAMTTQKDQLLSGASPTAVAAAQKTAGAAASDSTVPAAEAAAPSAAAAVEANLPNPPAKGEKCQTCGQLMPDDDDDDGAPIDPDSKASDYTVEMAMETMDLCAIAKVPVADAKAFVAAKTPITAVRAQLAAKAAAAADVLTVDGTAKPSGATEASVAAAWDSVVAEQNAKLPGATKR